MREQSEAAEVMDDFLFDETGARINSDWHAEAAALVGECADCVMGDFVFDETGARINSDWHAEADAEAGAATGEEAIAAAEEPGEAAAAGSGCRRKRQRGVPRSRMIIFQAPGRRGRRASSASSRSSLARTSCSRRQTTFGFCMLWRRRRGRLACMLGRWLRRASATQFWTLLRRPRRTRIVGSNSTYCFAGISAEQPEMLYTRTCCCSCQCCRDPKSRA